MKENRNEREKIERMQRNEKKKLGKFKILFFFKYFFLSY